MAFDPWTVGLTVLGGLFGSRSSSKAAKAQEAGQREALALQERMFNQMRQDYQPYMQAGVPALNAMMSMVGLQPLAQTVGGAGGVVGGSGGAFGGTSGTGMGGTTGVGGTLSSAALNPSQGGITPPGSMMPGISSGILHSGGAAGTQSGMSIPNQLRAVGQQMGIGGGPVYPTYTTEGDATMQEQMQGSPIFRPTGTSPYGTAVTGMGSYMSPRGAVVGEITPGMLPADPGIYIPPAMEAAAQAYRQQQEITPRYTGGPMMPGQTYSVGELEPEMVTTQSGINQLVTQPTVMSPTEPAQVTPGPIGQTLSQYPSDFMPMPQTINAPAQMPSTLSDIVQSQGAIAPTYQGMTDDPGYMFRFGEGQRALERSAAARGGLLSGGTGRRLAKFGQEMGSQEYMNRFNRLASIAGMGQVMTQGSGQMGMGYGGNMGNILGGIGTSRASGYLGQGSAIGSSLENLAYLRARFGGG